jgi:hypothetical protein
MTKKQWVVALAVVGVLFLAEVAAVRQFFASEVGGVADFHSRWYGARALLLEGRDPYSPEVTAEIVAIRDPEGRQTNSFSFAFPLHVIFVFWPLTYLSYDWTQAFWMVTLQWVTFATAAAVMAMVRWRPSPLGLAGALTAAIIFYPAARTILLGQFTLHVTLFLALSLLALRRGQDGWAGVWLAATSIKPQMVIMVGLWMVLWALVQKRWDFLRGLVLGGLAMLLGSMIWLPRWPISFLEDIQRYAEVASGRNPIEVLIELLWPGVGPDGLSAGYYLMGGLLLALTGLAWYWGLRKGQEVGSEQERFEWVFFWTMAVSLLVLFQTGSTNQAVLFIPLALWFWQLLQRWGRLPAIVAAVVVLFGPWLLFLETISGDYEHPMLLLPLPLLCLAVLAGQMIGGRGRVPAAAGGEVGSL